MSKTLRAMMSDHEERDSFIWCFGRNSANLRAQREAREIAGKTQPAGLAIYTLRETGFLARGPHHPGPAALAESLDRLTSLSIEGFEDYLISLQSEGE